MRPFPLFAAMACMALAAGQPARAAASDPTDPGLVARGQYLARLADCEACHTAPGGAPFAGGRAFALPGMGTLYASNITPDAQNGIGAWSDEQFVRAVREGVSPGWKHLYPAMPYQDYARMTPDEVRAIRAYLATVKPVARRPPENKVRFPFSIRAVMIGWNLFNGPASSYPDDPARSAAWNRGRWLVEGPGHCAECHSPRNLTMGVSQSHAYAGAVTAGWMAYNLSSDPHDGLGSWPDDALTAYLTTGHADGHGTAAGPMAEVISYSLRFMTPSDRMAMITYLRSLRPQSSGPSRDASGERASVALAKGATLFAGACAGCHLTTGSGRQIDFATITGAHSLKDPDGHNLIQVMLEGSRLSTDQGAIDMPRFGAGYSDQDLADIAAYTLITLGKTQPAFNENALRDGRQRSE